VAKVIRVGWPPGTAAGRLTPLVSYVWEFAILAHKGGLDCTKTPVYRGDGTKMARPNVDVKVDKKTGLVIPEKSGCQSTSISRSCSAGSIRLRA
jgi:hypothetical protein